MPFESKDFEVYCQNQILKDLDKRSLNGSYIYLAAWIVIAFGSGLASQSPFSFWLAAALLALFSVSRLFVHFYISKSEKYSFSCRINLHFFNVLMPSLVFSVLFSLAMALPEFESAFNYLLMVIFAFLSAGTLNFSPIKSLSVTYIIALTIIPLFTALFLSDDRFIESMLLVLYASYMLLLGVRLNREYLLHLEQKFTLKKLNQEDSLTGISNRRHFDKSIERAWKDGVRSGASLVLMLIDVDYFKRVNDNYGHAAGDQVIKTIASILQSSCRRENDITARIGGEEFAILYTQYSDQPPQAIAEKIRDQIAHTEILVDDVPIYVTCSFGIATCKPELNKSIKEFYKAADDCLYEAKNSGRDQVISKQY